MIRRVAIDQNAVIVRIDLHFLSVHLAVTLFPRFYDEMRGNLRVRHAVLGQRGRNRREKHQREDQNELHRNEAAAIR